MVDAFDLYNPPIEDHATDPSAHHSQTTDAALLTSGVFARGRIPVIATPSGNLKHDVIGPWSHTGDTNYTKVVTVTIPAGYVTGSAIRTSYTLYTGGAGIAYGKIYRNGVAHGAEFSHNDATPTAHAAEDLAFVAGDTYEIWLHPDAGGNTALCGLLEIYCDNAAATFIVPTWV